MRHFLDHLRLDRAISKSLTIEILALVAHAVSSVANNGDLNLSVFGETSLLTALGRFHGDLHACGHSLIVFGLADIAGGKTGTQGVHIEEGVFAVLDAGHGLPVKRLVARVASSRQVHVRLLVGNLNALEPKNDKSASQILTQHRGS